jgi:hypothetical protein
MATSVTVGNSRIVPRVGSRRIGAGMPQLRRIAVIGTSHRFVVTYENE